MKRMFRDAHTAHEWTDRFLALFLISVPLILRDLFLAAGSLPYLLWYLAAIGGVIVVRYHRFHDARTARKWAEGFLLLFLIGAPLIGYDAFTADGSRLWVLWFLAAFGGARVLLRHRPASTTNGVPR